MKDEKIFQNSYKCAESIAIRVRSSYSNGLCRIRNPVGGSRQIFLINAL